MSRYRVRIMETRETDYIIEAASELAAARLAVAEAEAPIATSSRTGWEVYDRQVKVDGERLRHFDVTA